jgi:hypothetical protein
MGTHFTRIICVILALSVFAPILRAQAQTDLDLAHAIESRISRVAEFEFIREQASALGVRAYLFGGTAAAYAHYVKWDTEREAGDTRYQADRFDYAYSSIFRSNQDLDIVVDGTPEQARQLQLQLSERFQYFQGKNSAWEVRLLRQPMGDKQALLNNPEFMNQNTDSNSTGLIEITQAPAGEEGVHDLLDWTSADPYFLRDVNEGKIHYYFSKNHVNTKFAREGRNPPILSVIRYLTKAFQYDLEIRQEDLQRIQPIINDFKPNGPELKNSYVRKWLLKKDYGRKLVLNAANVEYALDTLEKLGLRKKLIAIENNPELPGSLAWLLSKEPLRSHPVGIDPATGLPGSGPTARELGYTVVAHEANSYFTYESIAVDPTGAPNVLISREEARGEFAAFGNGFYTRIGREGARNTGFTIRFTIDPAARLGVDFTQHKDYLIFHNRNALRVIPESLNVSALQLFEHISEGNDFSKSDLGMQEKLKLKLMQRGALISEEDEKKIVAIARKELWKPDPNPLLVDVWFSLPFSSHYPDIYEKYLDGGKNASAFIRHVLTQPQWRDRTDLIESLLRDGKNNDDITQLVLSQPGHKNTMSIIEKMIDRGDSDTSIALNTFKNPDWRTRPDLLNKLLDRRKKIVDQEIAEKILTDPEWSDHPEFLDKVIEHRLLPMSGFVKNVLSLSHWSDPAVVEKLIDEGTLDSPIAEHVLSGPMGLAHPYLVEKLIRNGTADADIARFVLSQPEWADRVDLVKALVLAGHVEDKTMNQRLFNLPQWKTHPALLALCEGKELTARNLRRALGVQAKNGNSRMHCFFEKIRDALTKR